MHLNRCFTSCRNSAVQAQTLLCIATQLILRMQESNMVEPSSNADFIKVSTQVKSKNEKASPQTLLESTAQVKYSVTARVDNHGAILPYPRAIISISLAWLPLRKRRGWFSF